MARQADIGGTAGAAFAKLSELGDTLIAAFAGGKSRQQQDFNTKTPKVKDDGRPMLEEVAYFVAMPGVTAHTGDVTEPDPITAGDTVRYSFAGYRWGQVIDARKALPAYAGFPVGRSCSGDVYTITLIGWSAATDNAAAAMKAGFTVVDGRIVLRSNDDREKWVLSRLKANQNTNAAKDYTITIRRPAADEKRWEQAADALFDTKPWEQAAAAVDAHTDDEEPF